MNNLSQQKDQAKKLRELAEKKRKGSKKAQDKMLSRSNKRVIAVASGKGGVGKTNLVINLGIALARSAKKILVLDADLGLANVDVLLDINPKYNLQHLISGQKSLSDIIVEGPNQIKIVPGGSGIIELADMTDGQRERLISSFVELENQSDITLIDTGAGISKNVLSFILAAGEVLILTTPEPTAITDAYGLIKVINQKDIDVDIKLLVNMASNEKEAKEVSERISLVSKQFLNKHIEDFGFVLRDSAISQAVKRQQPFILSFPYSDASKCINRIANRFDDTAPKTSNGEGLRGFLSKLFRIGENYGHL